MVVVIIAECARAHEADGLAMLPSVTHDAVFLQETLFPEKRFNYRLSRLRADARHITRRSAAAAGRGSCGSAAWAGAPDVFVINNHDGPGNIQVLVLLAGYSRGRYARLQRDWAAACGGLAECAEAVEVLCRCDSHLIHSLVWFCMRQLIMCVFLQALLQRGFRRRSLWLLKVTVPPSSRHIHCLTFLHQQFEIVSEQLVACLLSSAGADELRRLLEMNVSRIMGLG